MTTGCVTTMEPEAPPPATQADINYLRGELQRLIARLDATDAEIGNLHRELAAGRAQQPAYASAAQLQAVQSQLDSLQQQIRTLDAARAQDKREIYDDIAKKVATLLKTAPTPSGPSRPAARTGSQTGYEHVVQPGETLSKIAAAYKVKMSVILEANNLTNPDSIRVGQKLFIPD